MEDKKDNRKTGQEQQAKVYNRLKRRIRYVEMGLGLVFLVTLLVTGLTFQLRDIAARVTSNFYVVVFIYFFILTVIFELITLPLDVFSEFTIERRFGLLRQSGWSWVRDYMKSFFLSLVLGGLAVEVLYFFIRFAGDWWWLPAGGAFTLLFVLLAQLTPVLILPFFYKFKPLRDNDLSARLIALCNRAGARIRGIYEWGLSSKTRQVNAALTGWGPTRRVLLSDNLIKDFSPSEVEIILAHELGHYKLHHLPKLLGIQALLTFVTFGLSNLFFKIFGPGLNLRTLDDVAGLPLLVLIFTLVGLVALPIMNLLSRHLERAADYFAFKLTDQTDIFISAMKRLTELNLSESDPNPVIEFLFHSHPSPGKRIQAARDFLSEQEESTV